MDQNILLLYMSIYNNHTVDANGHKKRLTRPQTNEMAVVTLQKNKVSRPDKIIALCSESVRNLPRVLTAGASEQMITTLQYFRDEFLPSQNIPPEKLVVVPVPDSMTEQDQTKAIAAILNEVETGDSLYIDLSGGMRDTVMLIVAVARYLKDIRDVTTHRVVYAELPQNNMPVLRDSIALYNFFDLISAVDEFFSTGSVQKLKMCLLPEARKKQAFNELLGQINTFSDDLMLCKVNSLEQDLEDLAKKIKESSVEKDNLMGLLYELMNERFESEFAPLIQDKKDNLPALIKWCASHRMYQQALTLLSERMPDYLCRHLFIQPTQKGWDFMSLQAQNKGKSWTYPLFHFHICRFVLMHYYTYGKPAYVYRVNLRLTDSKSDADGVALFRVANSSEIHAFFDQAVRAGDLLVDENQLDRIEQGASFYQIVQQYRNQINHASDDMSGYRRDGVLELDAKEIQNKLEDIVEYLQELKPLKPMAPAGVTPLSLEQKFPIK